MAQMLPSKVLPAEEAAGYRGNNGGEGLKSVIESSLHRIDPELGAISGITKADISHKFSAITVYMVDNKWFAKFVSGGLAILSIVDMVLDLVMIARFHAAGKSGYATATTVCLSLCLVLQVAFTYVQNCKRSWRRIIGETLVVFSLLRPALDAWRVATYTREKRDGEDLIDTKANTSLTRSLELVCEAIPGTVILMSALITGEKTDNALLLSLISSLASAAAMSAYISLDWDTDDENRHVRPKFYGYIPSDFRRKVVIMLAIFTGCLCNLFVRALACVVLSLDGMQTVAFVLGSEMLLYYAIKLGQRDFLIWPPLTGTLCIIASLVFRAIPKLMTDWAFCLQVRNPVDLGGAYFCFSIVCTVALGLGSVFTMSEVEGGAFTKEDITMAMISACASLVISFTVLLCTIDQKYLDSFITTKTGNEFIQDVFTKNDEDELKMFLLDYAEQKWRPYIGEEVKAWFSDRILVWISEKPKWLTDFHLASIPDWAVDSKAVFEKLRTKEVKAIRASMKARHSIRPLIIGGRGKGEGGVTSLRRKSTKRTSFIHS